MKKQEYFSRGDHGGFDEELLREQLQQANKNMKNVEPKGLHPLCNCCKQELEEFGATLLSLQIIMRW
jgi:hypothetical protein